MPSTDTAAAKLPPPTGRLSGNWHGLLRSRLVVPATRCSHRRPCKAALRSIEIARVKPLLVDLGGDFLEFGCETGALKIRDLLDVWTTAAIRKYGVLRRGDAELIETSVKLFVDSGDFDDADYVTHADLCEFLFGTRSERGPMKDLQAKLKQAISNSLDSLIKVAEHLQIWGGRPNGLITVPDLRAQVAELAALLEMSAEEGECVANHLLEEVEAEPSGEIDYWDAVAHLLGRRRMPVELLLYDISAGFTKFAGQMLLGPRFEAMYHSGIIIFGKEYWYGGRVFKSTPAHEVLNFGPTLTESVMHLKPSSYVPELQTLHLGQTLATAKEWHSFVNRKLCRDYRPDNYDVLTHNCNCFSSAGVAFLSGRRLPEEIMRLPDLVLSTRTASLLRSLLNGRLGGLGGAPAAAGARTEAAGLEEAPRESTGGICDVVCSTRLRGTRGCIVPGLVACCGGPQEDEAEMELSI